MEKKQPKFVLQLPLNSEQIKSNDFPKYIKKPEGKKETTKWFLKKRLGEVK